MHILQVSKADVLGGAERVALTLHEAYLACGHEAWLAVDERHTTQPGVVQIPPRPWTRWSRPLLSPERTVRGTNTHRLRTYATNPGAFRRAILGQDSFAYPGTRRLDKVVPQELDVLHAHNLHSSYFDLRALATLARRVPLVVTLHDAWLLTGGCTHPLDCTRYLTGCGACPYRHLHFRASFVDSTAYNHRRKTRALRGAQLHIITPCRWLMDKIPGTILEPAVAGRHVIANGVDTAVFHPMDRAAARRSLNLPEQARIILHASANPRRNISKDFATMRAAVAHLAATTAGDRPQSDIPAGDILFLVLGESAGSEHISARAQIRFLPFTPSPADLVPYYAAADVYLQGSIADTFPNTVLEAMACARAAVATRVGGIPEQIEEGRTGLLVEPGDVAGMAAALDQVLANGIRRDAMGDAAHAHVLEHFTVARQVEAHLSVYENLKARWRAGQHAD